MTNKFPTILIVDDSTTTRAVIARMIQATGVPVGPLVEAANGREALDVMASGAISLVLTDLNMPVMDGIELLNQMRGNEKLRAIPVVVISAQPDEAQIEQLKTAGANAYLQKPVTPKAIRDTIPPLLLTIEQAVPESGNPFTQDLTNALAQALDEMALISPDMREPIDLNAQVEVRMTTIAFSGDGLHGSLSLKAPKAFGEAVAGQSTLGNTQEAADDALNELANITCGLFLRRHFARMKGLAFGLPVMAWSDASLETDEESQWVITKAGGFIVAALVTVEQTLAALGK